MSRAPARKMAQAKRRNSHGSRQSNASGPWMVAGVALALFILGLFYLHHHRKHHPTQKVEATKPVKSHSKPVAKAVATKPVKETPQFDFYTMLPDMQVGDSDVKQKPVGSEQTAKTNLPQQYILQAGAFKRLPDADKVRAALILQGFNVQIRAVQVNNVTWQRIIIGPYKTAAEAEQAQEKLTKMGVKSLLFQLA